MKQYLNLLQPVEFDRSFEPLSTVLHQKHDFNGQQIYFDSQKFSSKFVVYPFELKRYDLIPFADAVNFRRHIQSFIQSDEGAALKTIGRSIVLTVAGLTKLKQTSKLTTYISRLIDDSDDDSTDYSTDVQQFLRIIVKTSKQFVKTHSLSNNADQIPVAFDWFSDSTAYHFLPSKPPFCQKTVQNGQQYDFGPFVLTALHHNQTSNVKIKTVCFVYLHCFQIFELNLNDLNEKLFDKTNHNDNGTIGCRGSDVDRVKRCQYLFQRCQINVGKPEQGQNLRFKFINNQFFGQIDGHFVNGPFNGPLFQRNDAD